MLVCACDRADNVVRLGGWLDRARQLQQAVRQHVQVEETRIYPAMRARMSADQNAMVTQMYVREGKKYDGA